VTRIDVLPAGWGPRRRMLAMGAALLRLRRQGYRDVFVRISIPAGLVCATWGRLLGLRSSYWNSGQGKNIAPAWRGGPRQLWRRLRYEANLVPFYLLVKLVHRFVTGPAGMDAYYSRHYGVDPGKIVLFANDIDMARFRGRLAATDRSAIRARLRVPEDAPLLLFVGRVSPLKGGAYLLPIAARVLAKHPDAVMLVAGAVHLPAFPEEWQRHPFRERIRLLGPVPNRDIAALYGASDVFLLPSNSEGFPRVLLECLAAGLAFVAFDVGGVRHIADPAHSRFIVGRGDVDAFADRVLELIADPAARARAGALGPDRARAFDTPVVADLFVRVVAHGTGA
jgi:glycosyltransferase involved in cell wall biosynthesis